MHKKFKSGTETVNDAPGHASNCTISVKNLLCKTGALKLMWVLVL